MDGITWHHTHIHTEAIHHHNIIVQYMQEQKPLEKK